jgi:superoxide dismutase
MVLHEYYFENLKRGGTAEPPPNAAFRQAAEESFGSFALWKTDFTSVGKCAA